MSLPANLEAEQALLGAMLVGVKDVDLDPDQFYLPKHQTIFAALREVEAPDVVTVTAELKRRGELETIGGENYLHELAQAILVAGNASHYAQLVREDSLLREARGIGQELMQLAEWNGVVPQAVKRLHDLAERAVPARSFDVLTAKQMFELPEPEGCDELLGTLLRLGDRLVIGAGTGEGKTSLATAIVRAVVNGEPFLGWHGAGGCRALIIDAEQGIRTIKRRLREAGLDEHESVDYLSVPDGLSLDTDPRDVAGIEAVLAGGYSVVLADPLYKLHRGNSNDEREATDLMRRFDAWRAEYGFGLIQPVHLRKPPPGAKFTLAEFYGSSAYTRGAEVVLGLRRLSAGYAQLHFLKDRDGDLPPMGTKWGLLFDREQGFRRDPNDGETPTARDQVAQLLAERPGITIAELRDATGYADRTIHGALKDLHAKGSGMPKRWELPAEQEGFELS